MAKKQSLSYGPNMGLIAGEAQVAASETALANVNQSFVTGAASMFGAIQQANKERDAKMEAYETQVGGLPDINQFEDPENKQKIKNFLNTQRDEYVRLADLYENTKDRDVKDKMEQIKFSLVNLNDQIKTFNQDKLDYRTANEENQLASLRTYQEKDGTDFFTNAFTNNAAFSIDEQGDMVFGINKNSYKYKDKAGKWNSKNNIDESNVLSIYSEVYKSGGKGDKFNTDNVRRGLYNSFKNTGNSALQVFATTDLTSDTSDLSFEAQFASGSLKEKHPEMYKGFTAESNGTYDTNWMFDNKNGDILRNKVSDYFTKVMEDGHGQGRSDNYKAKIIETDDDLFGKGKVVPGFTSDGWQTGKTLTNRRNFALDLMPFNGLAGEYKYDDGNKNWLLNDNKEKPMTMYDVLKNEGLLVLGDKPTELGAKGGKKASALNMLGETVDNGLLTNVFMMDDNAAITQMKLALPKNFIIKPGANKVGKFFGVDKVKVVSDAGIDLGTFDVGYDDSKKALEESKRFNSNLQNYLTGEI